MTQNNPLIQAQVDNWSADRTGKAQEIQDAHSAELNRLGYKSHEINYGGIDASVNSPHSSMVDGSSLRTRRTRRGVIVHDYTD